MCVVLLAPGVQILIRTLSYRYYLNRTYESLADINRTVVTEGEAKAWKFYSSGIVVKTSTGVFSVDVVQGQWKDIMFDDGDPSGNGEGSCKPGTRSRTKADGGQCMY